jgi:hypothetical protein
MRLPTSAGRYLVERMRGLELYDLWLRAGHRHPASWIEFLCEGEGVFGDCIQAWKRKSRGSSSQLL